MNLTITSVFAINCGLVFIPRRDLDLGDSQHISVVVKWTTVYFLYLQFIADMIWLIHSVLVDLQLVHYLPLTPTRVGEASCKAISIAEQIKDGRVNYFTK